MKTFLTVLKNDYLRTAPRLSSTIVMSVVMIGTIILALYMTGLQEIKGHIAFISNDTSVQIPAHSSFLEVTKVAEKPPLSSLYKQKYDAFVSFASDGSLSIETLRNKKFRSMIELLFAHPEITEKEQLPVTHRSSGENIIGFLMMFLLMQAFANLFTFADDKEQGQLVRIAAAPVSFGWYIAAHCVYSLSILFPSWLTLAILKIFGINIGFTLGEYALLIAIIGFFGISFALLLSTFITKPDNANQLGNAVIMLATILAGSFYAAPPEHSFFNHIIGVLPQKTILDFTQALATGNGLQHIGQILYAVGVSLVLLGWACVVLKKKYIAR